MRRSMIPSCGGPLISRSIAMKSSAASCTGSGRGRKGPFRHFFRGTCVAYRPRSLPTPRDGCWPVGSGEAALEQLVQARLDAVGFDVAIRQLEFSTYSDRVNGPGHQFDAAMMGIPGDVDLGYLAHVAQIAGVAA